MKEILALALTAIAAINSTNSDINTTTTAKQESQKVYSDAGELYKSVDNINDAKNIASDYDILLTDYNDKNKVATYNTLGNNPELVKLYGEIAGLKELLLTKKDAVETKEIIKEKTKETIIEKPIYLVSENSLFALSDTEEEADNIVKEYKGKIYFDDFIEKDKVAIFITNLNSDSVIKWGETRNLTKLTKEYPEIITPSQNELINPEWVNSQVYCKASTEEEAKRIEQEYEGKLELYKYIYGIATYYTNMDLDELIKYGKINGLTELYKNYIVYFIFHHFFFFFLNFHFIFL